MGAGNNERGQVTGGLLTWRFQQLLHAWPSSLRQEQVQWIGKLSTAFPDAEIIGVDLLIEWFKFGCLRLSISWMRCLSSVDCTLNSWLVHPKQTLFQPHSAASHSSRPQLIPDILRTTVICGRLNPRKHSSAPSNDSRHKCASCRVFSATP